MSIEKNDLPKWQLYSLMALMLLFGTANTLIMKYQNEYRISDSRVAGSTGKYVHPYF